MTEIRFYHLITQSLEQALPSIVNKGLGAGHKSVVRFANDKEVAAFNEHFWTYNPESFLPHGSKSDAHAESQPVYLTAANENPNGANMLVLCNQTEMPANLADFTLCCDFLDGKDEEAVHAARARWKSYKDAGHAVTYWQQTDTGGWEQKA